MNKCNVEGTLAAMHTPVPEQLWTKIKRMAAEQIAIDLLHTLEALQQPNNLENRNRIEAVTEPLKQMIILRKGA